MAAKASKGAAMPVTAKICGLSTPETLDAAIAGGASHAGFVFFPKSPRHVEIETAAALAERAAGRIGLVGLFVNPDPALIDAVRARVRLNALQLHGDEHPALVSRLRQRHGIEVWKAIPVRAAKDLAASRDYIGAATRILFDAKPPPGSDLPGGNGLRFDWTLLQGYRHALPWLLSGGLDAANVAEAVGISGAALVDASSGIESAPGVKDPGRIAAFLKAVAAL